MVGRKVDDGDGRTDGEGSGLAVMTMDGYGQGVDVQGKIVGEGDMVVAESRNMTHSGTKVNPPDNRIRCIISDLIITRNLGGPGESRNEIDPERRLRIIGYLDNKQGFGPGARSAPEKITILVIQQRQDP